MRKNSRMMEFCSVVNRLLKEDPAARSRHLQLRTFSVLPLTEESGLIEWVPSTTAFRHLVRTQHDRAGIVTDYSVIKKLFEQCEVGNLKSEIQLYHTMLNMYPALFHRWFLSNFPEPTAWFHSRLLYSYSCSVWSMIGYIVGLGDRHGENILINETTGECVHVDFDCLFDKGLTLEKPERVPFRLTPNIIDGLGIWGVEGPFRCAAESVIKVLRQNQQICLSVLHTFLHDPLVEWKNNSQTTNNNPSTTAGNNELLEFNSTASEKLEEISSKLKGQVSRESLPVSVPGQVYQLIKDASSEENLSRMYIGWMSWL